MLLHHAKNRRGSTLLMVIIVFALLLVFGMAALTLSANASRNAVTDYQTQQAYFTARSAVLAAVDYVKADADPKALLDKLDGKTSVKTTDPQLGEYTLTVNKLDDTRYELISNAEVDGKTRRMSVILAVEDSAFPFGQNLVTATKLNGVGSTLGGGANIYGDLMINDTISLPAGVNVYGNLYVDGPVSITGGPKVKKYNGKGGNIYANDNLTLGSVSVEVDGNIYCAGNLYGNGGGISALSGSQILVGGNMGGSGFSVSRPGNVIVWGNGDFRNCTLRTQINRIYFGGTYKRYQNDNSFSSLTVFEGYSPTLNGYELPDMSYGDAIEELDKLVDLPVYEAFVNSFKSNTVNINGSWQQSLTVSQSGTLGTVSNFNGTIVVDTSAGDVHWYITNSSKNVFSSCSVKVAGANQLILHLAKGVNFNSLSYTKLGIVGTGNDISKDTKPQICIIAPYGKVASEKNAIVLGGSAKLAAYVIMPYGDFTANGGSTFVGNMIVGSSQLQAGADLYYQTPNYPKIPGIGDISVGGDGAGGGAGGGVSLMGVYTTRGE